MSTRLYWTNIRSAANNVLRPVQPTNYWRMGRSSEQLRDVAAQSDEHIESDFSGQSCQSNEYAGTCHRNRATACSGNNHCYANGCGHQTDTGSDEGHSDTECNDCKCYNCDCGDEDGTTPSTPSAERERTSTGIWIGNELGAYQRADQISAAGIEHITGIPTGVAI